jgi:hypothetical protein
MIRNTSRLVYALTAVAAVSSVLLATVGPGSISSATSSVESSVTSPVTTPLATSIQSPFGIWATLPMGHLNQPLNTFWQLLYRPAGSTIWSDQVKATATATNGGLILASATGQPFITGVRPTNLLHFSPLISTDNGGHSWSNGLLPAGLAARPDALALAPSGHSLALVNDGEGSEVLTSKGNLSTWTTLTTSRKLAATPGGTSCSLTSLTAVAYLAGQPIVGASCRRSDVVGLLDQSGGIWQLDPVTLPGSLHKGRVTVLTIGQTANGLASVIEITDNHHAALLAAWTTNSGGWSFSPALSLTANEHAVSIGPANGIGLFVLTSSSSGANQLAVVNGPGAVWHQMPPPPRNTATVAFGTGSSAVDALAAYGTTMTVWTLGAGSSDWTKGQVMPVKLEFGSSS